MSKTEASVAGCKFEAVALRLVRLFLFSVSIVAKNLSAGSPPWEPCGNCSREIEELLTDFLSFFQLPPPSTKSSKLETIPYNFGVGGPHDWHMWFTGAQPDILYVCMYVWWNRTTQDPRTPTCMHTYTHTHTHTHTHTQLHTSSLHAHTPIYSRACIHAYVHIYKHTCIYTCLHAYIYLVHFFLKLVDLF